MQVKQSMQAYVSTLNRLRTYFNSSLTTIIGWIKHNTRIAISHCDEAMATVDDIEYKLIPTFFIADDEEKRKAREELVAGPIPLFLTRLESMLNERGGRYFAGDRLSVADLKVFMWVRYLQSGQFDHVPVDIVQQLAPALSEHCARITAVPEVAAYYEQRAAG